SLPHQFPFSPSPANPVTPPSPPAQSPRQHFSPTPRLPLFQMPRTQQPRHLSFRAKDRRCFGPKPRHSAPSSRFGSMSLSSIGGAEQMKRDPSTRPPRRTRSG